MKKLPSDLGKHFSYNAKTGELKRTTRCNSNGSYDKDGYLIVKFRGNQYKAHRIAWFLHYGKQPKYNIDHINGNRTDNRIDNLRDVPQQINVYNTKRTPNKDTGVIGIHYDKSTNGLKKKFTFRKNGKTYRHYTLAEAIKNKEHVYETC